MGKQTGRVVLGLFLLLVVVGGVLFLVFRDRESVAQSVVPVVQERSVARQPSSAGGGGAPVAPAVVNRTVVAPQQAVAPSADRSLETALYGAYLSEFFRSDGSVISNKKSVSWCPNACIGCDDDVTSEGVARLVKVAVARGDKQSLDRALGYVRSTMRHPETGYLMWKLNGDGSVGSCGGQNSAVDSELILIGALLDADKRWSNQGYGAEARALMESLKSGLTVNGYVPNCMYSQGGRAAACSQTVFLGYIELPVLKRMCHIDVFWCGVHTTNKNLMKSAVQGRGMYSTFYVDQNRWSWENADIHPQWLLKHLVMDGDSDSWAVARPFYEEARSLFLNNTAVGKSEICQEFHPESGCKVSNAPLRTYAGYLEMAVARNDVAFKNALLSYILGKMGSLPSKPLVGDDQYGNVVVLEALGVAYG
jgi:hypothetical protein